MWELWRDGRRPVAKDGGRKFQKGRVSLGQGLSINLEFRVGKKLESSHFLLKDEIPY